MPVIWKLIVTYTYIVRPDKQQNNFPLISNKDQNGTCLEWSFTSFKAERVGDHPNSQITRFLRYLGNNWGSPRTCAPTHTCCYKHKIWTLESICNGFLWFLSSLFPQKWIPTRTCISIKWFESKDTIQPQGPQYIRKQNSYTTHIKVWELLY